MHAIYPKSMYTLTIGSLQLQMSDGRDCIDLRLGTTGGVVPDRG